MKIGKVLLCTSYLHSPPNNPLAHRPYKEQAIATLNRLDQVLATQPFIAGDRFTVADITALAGLAFGGACQITIPETATHLQVWHDRMQQRPSFSA